ncbi:hypothetical protein BGX24_008901 [Mortierella sp. AD032]|nr:hypothetical protein BGX24_008901 [Mortierella sp. AD032]
MGAKGIALTGMGAKSFAVKAIAACYAKTVVVTGPATMLVHSIGASVGIPTVATTIKVAGGAVVGGVATIAVQERLNEPRHDDSECEFGCKYVITYGNLHREEDTAQAKEITDSDME